MAWVSAAYGLGDFPPGKQLLFTNFLDGLVPVLRDYLEAHARMYRAIKQADTVDADGDGVNAAIGLTMTNTDWKPARSHLPSFRAADVAARDRIDYTFNVLVPESLRRGTFDADLDGAPEESHPSWAATLDWLGVQYYFRAGVTADPALLPVLDATACSGAIDFGACLFPKDRTHCVPTMGYEFSEHGLYEILKEISAAWSDLPLVVTEAGIATEVGERRAEHIVRSLEQIVRAQRDGVDVRGYYHWTLYDNFEWERGFLPRFGLYRTDYTTYERTPTKGAEVLSAIAASRTVTGEQRALYGGTGPMTPDPALPAGATLCNALLISPSTPVVSRAKEQARECAGGGEDRE
jgi:beta-glucosidase